MLELAKQHVVLVAPEIPQNTGNIARTCSVTGSTLHLVRPLGFSIEDRYLKRAGLDYWDYLDVRVHSDFTSVEEKLGKLPFYIISTRGSRWYHQVGYKEESVLVFGSETAGLPRWIMEKYKENRIRIPMLEGRRSLNLSSAVSVVLYEALKQMGFRGFM